MSTHVEFQRVKAELAALRGRVRELSDDLREYNPGFGDYARAGILVGSLLTTDADA